MVIGDEYVSQQARNLDKEIVKRVQLEYLLHVPPSYGETNKKWPLILFLHGRGERGTSLERLKRYGVAKLVEHQTDFPFIAVSPLCPQFSHWTQERDSLLALLDEIIANYAVDENRIYLTGISMGGYGTWDLAMFAPERFAAIAPVCSTGPNEKIHLLKDMPTWVFHGAKDTIVPVENSEKMVAELQACGGNPKLTIYPDADHAGMTPLHDNMELYEWFLQHSLDQRKIVG